MNEVAGFLLFANILLIIVRLHRLENAVFNKKKDSEQEQDGLKHYSDGSIEP